jgi:S-DNA-T family DNA segregation ATPase FtsK/SpoIIIE
VHTSVNQLERDAVGGLAEAAEWRAEEEARIVSEARAGVSAAQRREEESVGKALRERDALVRQAEQALKRVLAQMETRWRASHSAIEATRDEGVRAFVSATDAMDTGAREKLEEKRWLADTVLESATRKAKQESESLRQELSAASRELSVIETSAAMMLRKHSHAVPAFDGAGGEDVAGATLGGFHKEGHACAGLLVLLEQRLRPVVTSAGMVAGVIVLAGLAGGAAGWVLRDALAPHLSRLLQGGGGQGGREIAAGLAAGLVLGGVAMLLVRMMMRRRVPRVAGELGERIARVKAMGRELLRQDELRWERVVSQGQARRTRDYDAARDEYAEVKARVEARRTGEEPALRATHDQRVKQSEEEYERRVSAAKEESRARVLEAQTACDALCAQAGAAREAGEREASQREADEMEALRAAFAARVERAMAAAARLKELSGLGEMPWGAAAWQGWEGAARLPEAVAIGAAKVAVREMNGGEPAWWRGGAMETDIAVALDLSSRGSLLLRHTAGVRTGAIGVLNNTMLRLMTSLPPAKVRFTILDPVGLGQSFAAFMHLADHDGQLINDRIWTDPRHIEQRLAELTEHMELVIQKYLRNEFQRIQDYNERAGEVAEPYRFLVVADFPTNISEQAARRVASIVTSGARCGVFTLIAQPEKAPLPPGITAEELARGSVCLRMSEAGVKRENDGVMSPWPVVLEAPPSEEEATSLLRVVGERAKEAGRVRVPFEMVSPGDGETWSLSCAESLRIPLGRAGANKLQYVTLGEGTAQHALIAGRTGSGKSTLLHVIITNAAQWYSPAEVELYLVDFKKGVEFKDYATHGLPHARVVAVESEREFGLSVLRRLDGVLTERGRLFRDLGVQDVAGYRRRAGPMPRVLLVVDEFQEFFVEDDKVAQESSLLLDRLVRQGRAFGMHVVLGSQTLGGAYSLARSTLGQMAVRIALQCSEADSYLIMSEDNAAPRLLARPGEAIYNDASGAVEGNNPFQVVWLSEDTRAESLSRVREAWERAPAALRASAPGAGEGMIVFEGHTPARVEANSGLGGAVVKGTDSEPVRLWLGDAVSIKEATHLPLRRQAAANLLVVGREEETAAALLATAMLSVWTQTGGRGRVVLFDGMASQTSEAGTLTWLAGELGGKSAGGLGGGAEQGATGAAAGAIPAVVSPRGVEDALRALGAELDAREASEGGEPLLVVFAGLQRFREVRKRDDFSFGGDGQTAAQPDKLFARLLRDGPALGVHVMAWCDTWANVDRTLERQSMREFDGRVLMQMSANDSTAIIDTPAASGLGRYRAILYRDEMGTTEKFRPYMMPERAWIEGVLGKVGAGGR